MNFREMDPDEVWRLLEEKDEKGRPLHENALAPLITKEDALLRHSPCPVCGEYGGEPFLSPTRPFIPGSPLPNRQLRCQKCHAEFDPNTRIVTSVRPERG